VGGESPQAYRSALIRAHNDAWRAHGRLTRAPAQARTRRKSRNSRPRPRDIARPTRALMHIHVRSGAVGRHMQKDSVRSDQTRPRNDAGTSPTLTGQGIPPRAAALRSSAPRRARCARAAPARSAACRPFLKLLFERCHRTSRISQQPCQQAQLRLAAEPGRLLNHDVRSDDERRVSERVEQQRRADRREGSIRARPETLDTPPKLLYHLIWQLWPTF